MTIPQPSNKDYLNRAVEVSINIGLVTLLAAACFQIVRPFQLLVVWSIIIAIAIYLAYRKIRTLSGGRGNFTAVLVTLLLLLFLSAFTTQERVSNILTEGLAVGEMSPLHQ